MIICSNDHIPRTFLFAQCWKTCQYFSVNSAIPFTIFFISREKLAFLTDGWQAILSPVAFFLLTDDNNVLLLMPIWELYFIVCQKDTAITFFSSINIDDFQRWNLRTSFACKWVLSWAYCLVKLSNPLKGKLSEVNQLGVEATRPVPIDKLLVRLNIAQRVVEEHIFNTEVQLIPYKKGSRDYSRKEHLEIVAAHIKRHLKDLHKKYHLKYAET